MACRSLKKAESAKSEIEASGVKGRLSTVQLDVTDEKSINQAVAHVQQEFGRLDALVNNAGIASSHPDLKTSLQQCFDTNVIGPALIAAAFRPLLLQSPMAYSIFVSSVVGSLSLASEELDSNMRRGPAYRTSKTALNMIALQEWVQWRSEGLKAFAVCPGFVRSYLRGTSEEAVSGFGKAKDPEESGHLILNIIQGHQDGDVGKFIHKDGVHPW
jgi:NAD(P)-dependent dehydrogenase (short-subunit alcohol dehydrogenase family)